MRDILTHLDAVRRKGAIQLAATEMRVEWPLVLFGVSYLAAYLYGNSLPSPAPIWPPDAVLLSALLLAPRRWRLYVLVTLPIRLFPPLAPGVPFWLLLLNWLNDTCTSLLAAVLVTGFARRRPLFASLRGSVTYIACAVLTAPLLSACLGAVGRAVLGHSFWASFATWFLGDALANLVLVPTILLWAGIGRERRQAVTQRRAAEALALATVLVVTCVWIFASPTAPLDGLAGRFYLIIPVFLWVAVSFGPLGTSTAFTVFTAIAMTQLTGIEAALAPRSPTASVFALQVFLLSIGAPFLLLATLIREREEREATLLEREATLLEGEARFRTMADRAPVLIWMSGPDALCTYFNAGWLAFTGRTLEQEYGNGWAEGVHPDDLSRCLDRYLTAFAARQPFELEYRLRRHDGVYRWVVDRGIPRTAPNGRLEGYIGSCIDITDRREAEEALRVSEARFRTAFASATTGMVLVGPDGHPMLVNRPMEEILGYSLEELRARPFVDFTFPDDVEPNLTLFQRTLAGEIDSYQLEKRFLHKRGHIVWVHLSAGAVRDATGQVLYFVGQVQDITERKETERALRESEERYRAVVSNLPQGAVLLFDEHLRHIFADGPGLAAVGLSRTRIESRTVWEAFPAEVAALLAPHYQQAIAGQSVALDLAYDERTYQVQVVPMPSAAAHAGSPHAGMVVLQDVTEQRRARDALERERTQGAYYSALSQEFRTLVEHSPDVITRFDRDLRHVYVSPQAVEVLGIPANERLGKTYGELGVPEAVYAPWERALRHVFATGEPCAFDTLSPYGGAKDEQLFHYHVRYIPELDADGDVVSILSITTDITPLKRTEEALRQASAAAEAARQEEERRRREAELREEIAESLRDVLAILNSNRPLEEILQYIVRQASRLLGSQSAAIYGAPRFIPLRQAHRAEPLILQAADGLDAPPAGHSTLPFAQAGVERALATQWPVAVLNACVPVAMVVERAGSGGDAEATVPIQIEALPSPYQAVLVVPIVVHEEVYGCLLLCYTAPCRFLPDEVTLALAYADQVALAIANARLQAHLDRAARVAERTRIAGELHDTVTQDIVAANRLAEAIPRNWDRRRAEAERALEQLHALTHGAVAGLRVLLLELRPTALEQMPLGDLLRQLSEAMTIRAAAPIAVRIEGETLSLPVHVKVALYRVAQEALTNAAKYAASHALVVRLRQWQTGRIVLEIRDDGKGFDPTTIPPGHLGLAMMRERAQAIGAVLRIHSQPRRGTRVVVEWRSQEAALAREVATTRVAAMAPAERAAPARAGTHPHGEPR